MLVNPCRSRSPTRWPPMNPPPPHTTTLSLFTGLLIAIVPFRRPQKHPPTTIRRATRASSALSAFPFTLKSRRRPIFLKPFDRLPEPVLQRRLRPKPDHLRRPAYIQTSPRLP